MKLIELKKAVDYYINTGAYREDADVVITLVEPSAGRRAFTDVLYAACGIDWEAGQFRLEPTVELCRKGRALDDPMEMRVHKYIYDNTTRLIRHCPVCETKLKTGDKYCSCCGQNVSKGEKITYERDLRTRQRV